jgi:hypothetical protein
MFAIGAERIRNEVILAELGTEPTDDATRPQGLARANLQASEGTGGSKWTPPLFFCSEAAA